jgi:hypothetical protein
VFSRSPCIEVLRHQICGIALSWHFVQGERFVLDLVLDQQELHVQVAQLSKTLSVGYSDRCA